jgi:hypothetical protein
MSNWSEKEIIATIFRKMFLIGEIGSSHTPFENLQKSFPSELRKEVKKIRKNLINKGYLLAQKHNYELGISLNPKKLIEIEKIIVEVFPELKEKFKLS